MRLFLRKKSPDVGQIPRPEPTHPLPWRNRPVDGTNHVVDVNGRAVYDGADAAEMFRLYSAEAQAEPAAWSAAGGAQATRRR